MSDVKLACGTKHSSFHIRMCLAIYYFIDSFSSEHIFMTTIVKIAGNFHSIRIPIDDTNNFRLFPNTAKSQLLISSKWSNFDYIYIIHCEYKKTEKEINGRIE